MLTTRLGGSLLNKLLIFKNKQTQNNNCYIYLQKYKWILTSAKSLVPEATQSQGVVSVEFASRKDQN